MAQGDDKQEPLGGRAPEPWQVYPDRAAAEVAPRDVEHGQGPENNTGMRTQGAVDENRPANVVNQAGIGDTTDVDAPRMSPNVLQRPHAIGPLGGFHQETAGEDLAEDEDEELTARRGDVTT